MVLTGGKLTKQVYLVVLLLLLDLPPGCLLFPHYIRHGVYVGRGVVSQHKEGALCSSISVGPGSCLADSAKRWACVVSYDPDMQFCQDGRDTDKMSWQ